MSVDVRDIFMVIRAKDQASRVINSIAMSATADFNKISREARLQGSRLGLEMANMRQKYDRAILQSRERLTAAQIAGDKVEARGARERIQRLQLIRDAQALNIRQQQLAVRGADLEAKTQLAARQATIEHNRELARTAGTWLAVGATMALVGGAGVVAMHRMAMGAVEYQRQAALTLTQVREQGKSVADLQRISNNVAAAIGVPFDRLQSSLYDIFSSTDLSVKESQSVLENFAKAAVAGQVDIQQAGRATIAFMNAFKDQGYSVNRILDIQFEAVRLGTMTYAEFASTVGRAIPAVRGSSQSIEFLAGSAAFLTRNGLSAAMAMTSIARASEMFLRKPVQQNLRSMGIEALDAAGRLRPINEIMAKLQPKFAGLDDMARKRLFEKIFGGQNFAQARRFFDLAIRDSKGLTRFINDVTKSSGAFGEAYGIMADTLAVKTERLKNQWRLFSNSIGQEATPALERLVDAGIGLLKWVNDLDGGQRRLIANTLMYGSVAITAVGGVIALAGGLRLLRAGFSMVAVESTLAAKGISLFAASTVGLVGIAIAAAAAIALGTVYLAKNINNAEKAAEAQEKYGLGLGRGAKATQMFSENAKELADRHRVLTATAIAGRAAVNSGADTFERATTNAQRYSNALERNIETGIDWANLTEDQQKIFDQLASAVASAIPIFEGYHAQQDKLRDAARDLREAQHDLAVAQGGAKSVADSYSPSLERVHDATVRVERAQLALKEGSGSTRLAQIRLREAQHDLTNAQQRAREETSKQPGGLEQVRNAVERVRKAEEAYREAKGLTAAQINRNLREEISAYKNWADNTQALLRRGANPQFVLELSRKGPQYVAAYVAGSDAQLRRGGILWEQREKQKTRVTKTQAGVALNAVQDFVIRVNRAHNNIDDENVILTAKLRSDWRGFTLFQKAVAQQRASGGPIRGPGTSTSDSILARLSHDEHVLSAREVKGLGGHAAVEQLRKHARGFAGGGAVLERSSMPNTQQIGRWASAHARVFRREFGKMTAHLGKDLNENFASMFAGLGDLQGGGGSGSLYRMVGNARNAMIFWRNLFPGMVLGGWRATGSVPGSDHPKGLAIDLMTTNKALHELIIRIGKTLPGAKYWISYSRIGMAPGWGVRPYSGPSPHTDHVHWSYYHRGGRLPEDVIGMGSSGRAYAFQGGETVTPRDGGGVHLHFHGNVYGGKAGADQFADEVLAAFQRKGRRFGNPDLPARIVGLR